jgi:hypothetical protein
MVNQERGQQRGPAPWSGRANYTTVEEIPTGEEVLASTIFLNECPIIILFDSRASHDFMSSACAVERVNGLIFEAIKKILEGEKKGKWAEIMPQAVWSHNTTMCRATNFMPFRLMYRAEVVLPEKVKHWSLWTTIEVPVCPSKAEEKDLLESDRLKAVANLQKYQEETRALRDPKVKSREFDVGNLVLLRRPHTKSTGKFEAKWFRPYIITEKMRPSAYRLSDP